jgi:hypothetical protein
VAEALVITIAVLGALAALGGAAFVAYRLRRLRHGHTPPAAVPQQRMPWRTQRHQAGLTEPPHAASGLAGR